MSRVARRVLLALTAVLVFAGASGVQQVRRGPSAQSVLDDARAFVQRNPGFRFTGTVALKSSNAVDIRGEVESGRRGHVVVTYLDVESVVETVVLENVSYTRTADAAAALAQAKYDKFEATRTTKGISRREDLDVAAWLATAHHPKQTRSENGLTNITTDVDVTTLYGAEARDIDWMTLRLTVHKTGELRSLVQVTRADAGTSTITLRFDDWGTFAVAAPPADQVDATPGIHEEDIAAFKDSALYMPKTLPKGWKLIRAVVLSENETVEGCAQVELEYGVLDGPNPGRITLYEFPFGCAQVLGGDNVVEFAAGAYRGFGRSSAADGTVVQISVGLTAIQVTTHELSLKEVAVLLTNLAPLKI